MGLIKSFMFLDFSVLGIIPPIFKTPQGQRTLHACKNGRCLAPNTFVKQFLSGERTWILTVSSFPLHLIIRWCDGILRAQGPHSISPSNWPYYTAFKFNPYEFWFLVLFELSAGVFYIRMCMCDISNNPLNPLKLAACATRELESLISACRWVCIHPLIQTANRCCWIGSNLHMVCCIVAS